MKRNYMIIIICSEIGFWNKLPYCGKDEIQLRTNSTPS